MDPEAIYAEVLAEEQQKGSASAVAEGRAKAARQRAHEGSPHPKEAKWWPGSQPQFEGPGAEAVAEAGGASEPTQEAEAPAPEPTPEPEPAPEPAPAAEAEAAPPAPPSEPVAAAPAEAPPAERPKGVSHGIAEGNRLRPEDTVGSEAQFAGQKAMYDRRKLIDDLVSSGVPEVTAADTGSRGSPILALLYLIIPLLAIGFLVANDDGAGAEGEPDHSSGGGNGAITLVAEAVAFDTDTLTLPADQEVTVGFDNKDSTVHNLSIYEDESASEVIFDGPDVQGPGETTYEFTAPPAGEYYFLCDTHPDMNGTVVSE